MKRLLLYAIVALIALGTWSCVGNDIEDNYKDWRAANNKWLAEQEARTENGKPYYTKVAAVWNPNAQVLIHWFNDTLKTYKNLKPLYTSTVDVRYRGQLYDDTPFDSSYLATSPADSIFRTELNADIIEGWPIAIMNMHVGDSCRVIIPYQLGYGTLEMDLIKPYSALQFDIKLADINKYQTH